MVKEKEKEVKNPELSFLEKIDLVLDQRYGDSIKPSIIDQRIKADWISLNILCGLELGTIMEVYGEFSSGKSFLMMLLGAAVQKMGGHFICFNTEAANRDKDFLERTIPNLNYDKIKFYQPEVIEDAFSAIKNIVDLTEINDAPLFIGVDSISMCAARAEVAEKAGISAVARAISSGLRLLCSPLSKKPIFLFLVSQTRVDIKSYMTPKRPTGGQAPEFVSSTVIKIAMNKDIPGEFKNAPIGKEAILEIKKSRFSTPKKITFNFYYETGIDNYEGLTDILIMNNVITRVGSYYDYKGARFQKKNLKDIISTITELKGII